MKLQNEKETKVTPCTGEEPAMNTTAKELTNEELIAQYQAEENEVIKSDLRDQFFLKNIRLPYYVAAKYKDISIPMDDLIALANFGMLKAFNTFVPEKNVKFMTYSSRVMHNEITMEIRKLYKKKLDTSMDKVLAKDSEGKDLMLEHILPDSSICIEDDAIQKDLVAKIYQKAREICNERDYAIFLNFMQETPKSQHDLSVELGIAQSYVSRIIKNIFRELREFFNPESPVVQELLLGNKNIKRPSAKVAIPEVSLKQKVFEIYATNPDMNHKDMAKKLNAQESTVYVYLFEARKAARNKEAVLA